MVNDDGHANWRCELMDQVKIVDIQMNFGVPPQRVYALQQLSGL